MTHEDHLLRIQLSGFTVMEGVLTPQECAEACRELARVVAEEETRPGYPSGPEGAWAYNLMNKSPIFERVYQIPEVLRLVRYFLGEDAVISGVMGRIVLPGAPAQGLHFDGSLTGPFRAPAPADGELRCVSHVFGLNLIWCLSEFTRMNGATRLVPGSHRLPTRTVPRENPPPDELIVEAPAGSLLLFNIAIWHGASEHQANEPRFSLITPWRRSWVRPEADLSRMVAPEVLERAGPEGSVIFGLSSRPPFVERWRWDTRTGLPHQNG
ncbi:MAG: hypothetical protein FJX77_01095 [Armatimonadetes bacterium]|nr:hypothetical protein [Armatimonadota bacterium]